MDWLHAFWHWICTNFERLIDALSAEGIKRAASELVAWVSRKLGRRAVEHAHPASHSAENALSFIHRSINDRLRNFVHVASTAAMDHAISPEVQKKTIEDTAQSTYQAVCNDLAAFVHNHNGLECFVCLRAHEFTERIVRKGGIQQSVEAACRETTDPTEREKQEHATLRELAWRCGGTGNEFIRPRKSDLAVVYIARTAWRSFGALGVGLVKGYSSLRYFDPTVPNRRRTGTAYRDGRVGELEARMYCIDYDLKELADRTARNALAAKWGEIYESPTHDDVWEHYRSIAVVPVRSEPTANNVWPAGYLTIDSPEPYAFRELGWSWSNPNVENIHFLFAIADVVGTMLRLERHFLEICRNGQPAGTDSNQSTIR